MVVLKCKSNDKYEENNNKPINTTLINKQKNPSS